MPSYYRPPLHLGILGGGQLGQMFIAPALSLGICLYFLDKDGAPCQEASKFFYKGSFIKYDDVLDFSKDLKNLTIEIENVNIEALSLLEKQGVSIFPSVNTIRIVQDKLLQKQYYQKHGFPTAKFKSIETKEDLGSHFFASPIPPVLPIVQKIRKSGYDGRGVKILKSTDDIKAWGQNFIAPSLIEEKIDFTKELSIVVVRDEKGNLAVYPPVEMRFHPVENLLESLICPAEIEESVKKRVEELACDLAQSLAIIGVLTIEFFLTTENELLINEISPRTHNSGHYTMDACANSQFEQHLRAIFKLPLGDTSCHSHAATLNLLGEADANGAACYLGLEEALKVPGLSLYLYNKKEVRPYRKMGHITVIASDRTELEKKMQNISGLVKCISKPRQV